MQGTYLPYQKIEQDKPKTIFAFPSPCRGLIFFTLDMPSVYHVCAGFRPLTGDLSSLQIWKTLLKKRISFRPLTGDLSSLRAIMTLQERSIKCFRPLTGDLSSLRVIMFMKKERSGFRPLTGDLSSLQFIWSGPFRDKGFRPLTGDLSSLHKSDICPRPNARFPSPCRGLIFLTSWKWSL